MNMTLLVAVTQRVDDCPERRERRDALDQKLIQFLSCAGFVPVPIPNNLCVTEQGKEEDGRALSQWLERLKPDAFVLSGGNNLGESLERDATENRLLNYASMKALPVLGLCRGMQQMGVWAGGELVKVDGHVRTRHVLEKITGDQCVPFEVNSYHHWALANCPEGFEILAWSDAGDIEAIRHLKLPWEGWMWHPERETVFSTVDLKRVKSLFFGVDG